MPLPWKLPEFERFFKGGVVILDHNDQEIIWFVVKKLNFNLEGFVLIMDHKKWIELLVLNLTERQNNVIIRGCKVEQ